MVSIEIKTDDEKLTPTVCNLINAIMDVMGGASNVDLNFSKVPGVRNTIININIPNNLESKPVKKFNAKVKKFPSNESVVVVRKKSANN